MAQSQYFVFAWIYFTIASAVLLQVTRLAIARLSQPADRIRLIYLALPGVLLIPVLLTFAPLTVWRMPLVEATKSNEQQPAHENEPRQDLANQSESGAPLMADQSPLAGPDAQAATIISDTSPSLATSSSTIATRSSQRIANEGQAVRSSFSPWDWAALTIMLSYLAATVYFLIETIVGMLLLRKVTRSGSPVTPEIAQAWDQITNRRGSHVTLLLSEGIDAPLVHGCVRPVVLLPSSLTTADVSTVSFCLSHEWCHIERRDLLAWHAMRLCQCPLWMLPSYWSVRAELRLQQDMLADDRSTRAKRDAVEYSELLLGYARSRMVPPMAGALTFSDRPTQLAKRVKMLLENSTIIRFQSSWTFSLATAASALFSALLIGAVRLDMPLAADDAKPITNQDSAQKSPESNNTKRPAEPKQPEEAKEKKEPPTTTADQNVELKYFCKVTDKETGKGIPNARVTIRRSEYTSTTDRIIEESKHVTDADGKYEVVIPKEQVAIGSLYIEIDAEHDDYAAKKGHGYALSMIRKNEKMGERPFGEFEDTALYPGESVTGTVVSPEDKPLAGIKIQCYSMGKRNDFNTSSFNDTVTDAEGHFKFNVHKGVDAVFWVIPKDYASIERFLAKQRGNQGVIKLTPGIRISGQVKSAEGSGVAGIAANIQFRGDRDVGGLPVSTSVRRGAITDAEGKFSFDPLPAGEYEIYASEWRGDPLSHDRTVHTVPGVFLRTKVALKESIPTQTIDVQAVPHVLLSGQIYNSKGEKRGGHAFDIHGQIDGGYWFGQGRPSKDGAFAVQIPHGMQKTRVQISGNEHQALRYRRGSGQPIENSEVNGVDFGTMNDDVEGFEVIYYKAPIVLVAAVDEDQKPIEKFQVSAAYPWGKQRYVLKDESRSDLSFEHQNDGRYRTWQMLPDEEVTFTLKSAGYESVSEKIKLAEGETKDLVVTLKKASAENPPPAAPEKDAEK